jgi:stearoyl-CoA desaturase (delta-9 desaturase)
MGFYWWEIDISYYVLKAMSTLGLVWDLRRPPHAALESNRIDDGHVDLAMLPWQEPSST